MSVVNVPLSLIQEEMSKSSGYMKNHRALSSSESIIIYLIVAGSVIPLRILESDSVESVKLRIQSCKGFIVKRQKLAKNVNEKVVHLISKLMDLVMITISTTYGKIFEFHVDKLKNIGYLKHRLAEKDQAFFNHDDHEFCYNGVKLDDRKAIDEITETETNDAMIHLVVRKSCQDFLLEPLLFNQKAEFPLSARDMFDSTFEGLAKGKTPVQSLEGSGGTYFMQHPIENKYVAVFKPIDEEPLAVNSPKKLLPLSQNGEGLKRGTRVGEGALREVVAYILDHPINGPRSLSSDEIGFAGVPPTIMVQCLHKEFNYPKGYDFSQENVKIGSLQKFVKNMGSCEDMGPRDFPVEEVHKISVLDIRTANADRHAGNILVSKGDDGKIKLIPIDHGYCLPENFEDCTFDWLYWPQAREPFSPKVIDYIKSLDADQDIALLKFYGWDLSLKCARTLRISTMLLKKGVEKRFTPFTIGSIMCRADMKTESLIERIMSEARDECLPETSEDVFMETVSKIMDMKLDEVVE